MKTETRSRRGRWKIAACVLLTAVALAAAGFFWYVSDYYRADEMPGGGDRRKDCGPVRVAQQFQKKDVTTGHVLLLGFRWPRGASILLIDSPFDFVFLATPKPCAARGRNCAGTQNEIGRFFDFAYSAFLCGRETVRKGMRFSKNSKKTVDGINFWTIMRKADR